VRVVSCLETLRELFERVWKLLGSMATHGTQSWWIWVRLGRVVVTLSFIGILLFIRTYSIQVRVDLDSFDDEESGYAF
jgi:hypothetical protein